MGMPWTTTKGTRYDVCLGQRRSGRKSLVPALSAFKHTKHTMVIKTFLKPKMKIFIFELKKTCRHIIKKNHDDSVFPKIKEGTCRMVFFYNFKGGMMRTASVPKGPLERSYRILSSETKQRYFSILFAGLLMGTGQFFVYVWGGRMALQFFFFIYFYF